MSHGLKREGGIVPITAGVDLTQGQLVKIVAGIAEVCTGSDTPLGSVTEDVAAGGIASVAVNGAASGTVFLDAFDGAIVVGSYLKPAAAGRVDGAATGNIVAVALEASGAQGDKIECALLTPTTRA